MEVDLTRRVTLQASLLSLKEGLQGGEMALLRPRVPQACEGLGVVVPEDLVGRAGLMRPLFTAVLCGDLPQQVPDHQERCRTSGKRDHVALDARQTCPLVASGAFQLASLLVPIPTCSLELPIELAAGTPGLIEPVPVSSQLLSVFGHLLVHSLQFGAQRGDLVALRLRLNLHPLPALEHHKVSDELVREVEAKQGVEPGT